MEDDKEKRSMNILLVEDNEADVKITLRAFKKAELKNNMFIVNNGEEALKYIRNEGEYEDKDEHPVPDIILLDINMPKADGFQVLDTLKNDPKYCSIPVIILTSSKREEDIIKSYKKGAASYIHKPVNYGDFVKVVEGFNFYWHLINRLPKGEEVLDDGKKDINNR